MLPTANVTISIDEETLRRARIRVLERGASLNALVREYLERLVGDDLDTTAARRFIEPIGASAQLERRCRPPVASRGRRRHLSVFPDTNVLVYV